MFLDNILLELQFLLSMWEEIIEVFARVLLSTREDFETVSLKEKFFHYAGDIVKPNLVNEIRRRKMLNSNSSFFNKNWFKDWIKQNNTFYIKQVLKRAIRDFLIQNTKMSSSLIKASEEAIENSDISANQLKKQAHSQKWYYLTNTHNSDYAIYRMRRRNISSNNLYTQLQIQFIKGDGTIYNYYQVPFFITFVMTIIEYRHITKNKYLAGAYNYFWYAFWKKSIHHISKDKFPYFRGTKIQQLKVLNDRIKLQEPIHRKMKLIKRMKKW